MVSELVSRCRLRASGFWTGEAAVLKSAGQRPMGAFGGIGNGLTWSLGVTF